MLFRLGSSAHLALDACATSSAQQPRPPPCPCRPAALPIRARRGPRVDGGARPHLPGSGAAQLRVSWEALTPCVRSRIASLSRGIARFDAPASEVRCATSTAPRLPSPFYLLGDACARHICTTPAHTRFASSFSLRASRLSTQRRVASQALRHQRSCTGSTANDQRVYSIARLVRGTTGWADHRHACEEGKHETASPG